MRGMRLNVKCIVAVLISLAVMTFAYPVFGEEGTWQTMAPMPTPRWGAAAGVVDGKLYVAGGYNPASGSVAVLEVYDPVTDTWQPLEPMPYARHGGGGAIIDGKLYVVGGEGKTNTLLVYDPNTDTWANGPSMSYARSSPAVAAVGGLLHVAGGCQGWCAPVTNVLEVYDPASNTWAIRAPMPDSGRAYAAVGVLNGLLYAMGGCCGYDATTSQAMAQAVEVYNPTSNTWSAMTDHLVGSGNTAGVINGKIYVAKMPDPEVYDPATDTWEALPPMPAELHESVSGVINGRLYVAGGYTSGYQASGALQVYIPDSDLDLVDDALDAFPNDPAASEDTDGDGYPDAWNADATAEMIAASALVLDAFPENPDAWLPANPAQPVHVSPPNPGLVDTLTPPLVAGPFTDPYGADHLMSHWQVSTSGTVAEFEQNLVLDLESATSLTTLGVPDFVLQPDRTYYWRVRFINANQYTSEWSDIFAFSTPSNSQDSDGDGIDDEFEIPSPIDLDGNGIDDNTQADIKSFLTSVGDARAAIKAGDGVIAVAQVKPVAPQALPAGGRPGDLPFGLIAFHLSVEPGAEAEVTIYFSKRLRRGMNWYKYDPAGGWYDFSTHAVMNAEQSTVILRLQDGGIGDADGLVNGIIIDPSGPVGEVASGGSSGGCIIESLK